ncbi:hypothetical protein [Hydrocarboniphaga sp.]|uniref:transmembrane-type terpene cyclase n=1 Tax=Hydrocarboniphaga sp. TaxID=2033016 RepID=UPI003D139A26
MYDPNATLQAIDDHVVAILLLNALALIANVIYFGEAVRLAARDRLYTMPLAGTLLFIAHDLSYILHYEKWFKQYHHWFSELYWFGLIATLALELLFFHQTMKYGRKELFPQLTQRAYTALLLAGLLGVGVFWWVLKQNLDDDLYVVSFFMTTMLCPMLSSGLLARRQSVRGQSTRMWIAFCVMVIAYFSWTQYLGDYFRSFWWRAFAVADLAWGLAMLWLVRSMSRKRSQVGNPLSS